VYDVNDTIQRERAEGPQRIYILPMKGGDFLAKRSDLHSLFGDPYMQIWNRKIVYKSMPCRLVAALEYNLDEVML